MNNLSAVWGERIRRLVHEMLRDERDVTVLELRQEMVSAYPDFTFSPMTLWRLLKGLGFSYKILKGQRYIFERSDIARKRPLYLRRIEEARTRGDCLVFMDETTHSTKREIVEYLASYGVEVAINSTKAALLEELNHFVASRGGLAALRCYAAERICEEMGVSLLRLPPFHCFFNPVELCWSYLKQRLNKIGRPTNRLETFLTTTNTSEDRFEEEFCQLLIESDEESEGRQDETADESQLHDDDPDFETESESGDEPEISWTTTASIHDRWTFTGEHGPAAH
ncbi:hypothetical protein OSTOST_25016, partial [Ostertagia ostertagi]